MHNHQSLMLVHSCSYLFLFTFYHSQIWMSWNMQIEYSLNTLCLSVSLFLCLCVFLSGGLTENLRKIFHTPSTDRGRGAPCRCLSAQAEVRPSSFQQCRTSAATRQWRASRTRIRTRARARTRTRIRSISRSLGLSVGGSSMEIQIYMPQE